MLTFAVPGSDSVLKAAKRARAFATKALAAGKRHLRPTDVVWVHQKGLRWSEIEDNLRAILQPHLDYDEAQRRARVELGRLRVAIRKNVPATQSWLAALAESLRGRFGQGHPSLRDFGVAPGAHRKPRASVQAAAAAKRRETRKQNPPRRKRR